jgi:hypothetical protein
MSEREVRWPEVKRHCDDEIRRLHNSLEVIQPEATTNQLRGEIRALHRVLKLGQPEAPEPPERIIQPEHGSDFIGF